MEGTAQTIEVAASQQFVYEIALDIETYPDWAGGVKSVAVTEEDEYGRPTVADFTVDAMIKETAPSATPLAAGAHAFAWTARPNDDLTLLEGTYTFNVIDDDNTEVIYALRAEPNFTVPGFLRRQAEKQIVGTALRGLKKRAEEAV